MEKEGDDFVKLYSRVEKYEGISDRMEIEIAQYLESIGNSHLSDETKATLRSMMREVSEIESIGDACYNIARILNRHNTSTAQFTHELETRINAMMQLVDASLTQMREIMTMPSADIDMERIMTAEQNINNLRNELREQNIADINDHKYDYAVGTMYMDMINECEKLADYIVNVVEARMQA